MEDWLKWKISHLVKYRQKQKKSNMHYGWQQCVSLHGKVLFSSPIDASEAIANC